MNKKTESRTESKAESYQELKSQLDTILGQLQNENTDIDEAMILHKKAQSVLKKLDTYLAEIGSSTVLADVQK